MKGCLHFPVSYLTISHGICYNAVAAEQAYHSHTWHKSFASNATDDRYYMLLLIIDGNYLFLSLSLHYNLSLELIVGWQITGSGIFQSLMERG
jgi:hypothetical protein